MKHSYPKDLALFVREHWEVDQSSLVRQGVIHEYSANSLPEPSVLEEILSICYQASLLQEEQRSVRFRLILQEPDRFAAEEGPPKGLHRLLFTKPVSCNEHELRRFSSAVDFYRSLLGIRLDPNEGLQIWGIIHSGLRWLQVLWGGGKRAQPLPPILVIRVTSPGRIAVCRGALTIATLAGGIITSPSMDVFDSQWLQEVFASPRSEIWDLHTAAREKTEKPWAMIDPDFLRIISQQVLRRMISLTRNARHGGSFIFVPPGRSDEFCHENRHITLNHMFAADEPRRRFRTLIVKLANALAETYFSVRSPDRVVGWNEYLSSKNQILLALDEAIFEWAHLVSNLSGSDGAVVLTTRFELLGFGAVISGELPMVHEVARAADPEGHVIVKESVGGVGLRHLSAYRLCNELHDVTSIVVSQDGSIRFIRWKDGLVTYWDQVATSILDV